MSASRGCLALGRWGWQPRSPSLRPLGSPTTSCRFGLPGQATGTKASRPVPLPGPVSPFHGGLPMCGPRCVPGQRGRSGPPGQRLLVQGSEADPPARLVSSSDDQKLRAGDITQVCTPQPAPHFPFSLVSVGFAHPHMSPWHSLKSPSPARQHDPLQCRLLTHKARR